MKFKVGDKVRVREDLVVGNFYGVGSFVDSMQYCKGEVFEITDVAGRTYILGGIWFRWTDEMLEEVNEEVQEKTFREVIADIKEGEVWENSHIRIYHIESNDNIVIEDKEGDARYRFTMLSEVKFRLKRKQYAFEEAFKAYEEGKEIESCYSGVTYKLQHGGSDCFGGGQKTSTIAFSEIRGKWYINN